MAEPADARLRDILLTFGEDIGDLPAVQAFLATNPSVNGMGRWLRDRPEASDDDIALFMKVAHHFGALGGQGDR